MRRKPGTKHRKISIVQKITRLKKRLESGRGSTRVTKSELAALLAERRTGLVNRRQHQQARAAADAYKPRKKDRGKIILIGTKGQTDPQKKGRRGHIAYVTTTGKVRLLKSGHRAKPWQAQRLRDVELPLRKNLSQRVKAFQKSRRVALERGEIGLGEGRGKGREKVKTGGAWDFNNKAVDKISKHVQKVLRAQRGQRVFLIRVIGLIQLPDGTKHTMEFFVDIARRDSDAIALGGVENFVRQKFYAHMAKELSYLGYVSSGSANHIRRLAANQGKAKQEWVDSRGQLWAGRDLNVARILSLEWKIEQAKS